MKTIGNIVWFICGGFLAALMWLMSGLICCVTVVGIPLGKQCFKFARLSAAPFGKDIRFGGGAPQLHCQLFYGLIRARLGRTQSTAPRWALSAAAR